MILEAVILTIKTGLSDEFERAFRLAEEIIASIPGYVSHQLQKCIEIDDQYLFLVNWETLEDHTEGFRKSEKYQQWKGLLHHFYDPFPAVLHYQTVN